MKRIEIRSKLRPDNMLLHFVIKSEDIPAGRTDLIEPDNFLQCAALNLAKGTTFKPHKHNWNMRNEHVIAQESWIVVKGRVRCIFYDLDGTHLQDVEIGPGEASFSLLGGHNYEILEENSVVMEYKTGKYLGQELDKTFL